MIGGAVGGVLLIAALVLYFCWWRKRKSLDDSGSGWAKTPAMLDAIADWAPDAEPDQDTVSALSSIRTQVRLNNIDIVVVLQPHF